MRYYKRADNCLYNPIYVKFNEDTQVSETFSYTLQYPSFFSLKNTNFTVNQNILNNISSTINSDVFTFKNGVTAIPNDVDGVEISQVESYSLHNICNKEYSEEEKNIMSNAPFVTLVNINKSSELKLINMILLCEGNLFLVTYKFF